jgi:hypothetical protein
MLFSIQASSNLCKQPGRLVCNYPSAAANFSQTWPYVISHYLSDSFSCEGADIFSLYKLH